MWHVGIDLHRQTLVVAAVDDAGAVRPVARIACSDTAAIVRAFEALRPFRAVIEATGTYRWLYKLLAPLGTVLLAHPLRLRAMLVRRSKTDRLDARLLADLLRVNQIPLSYIPDDDYQLLRDLVRYRTTLSRQVAQAKLHLRQLLARENADAPYACPFGPRGLYWFGRQDFGPVGNQVRDHAVERLQWTAGQLAAVDGKMKDLAPRFPRTAVLTELRGVGLFTAMVVVAEFGDVTRFRCAEQAAAYAGLTARVFQSGDKSRTGHISEQGSPWLRWVLVEAAMKLVAADHGLGNFYRRIAKRSGAKIARVAAARKLAEICYKRLLRWHRGQRAAATASAGRTAEPVPA
jgi:transposase